MPIKVAPELEIENIEDDAETTSNNVIGMVKPHPVEDMRFDRRI